MIGGPDGSAHWRGAAHVIESESEKQHDCTAER
jgi:hypothetical protein